MTVESLEELWRQHKLSLHDKEIYKLDDNSVSIAYLSSGVSIEGPQAFDSLTPCSPLNFESFDLMTLNLFSKATAASNELTGNVTEQVLFSWKAASYNESREDALESVNTSSPKRRFEGTQMATFFEFFFAGWQPVNLSPTVFSKLKLLLFITTEYEQGKILHLQIFWNQAELLSQLGIWDLLDEMKPTPAMKQFIFNLPIRSKQSVALDLGKLSPLVNGSSTAASDAHNKPKSIHHINTRANLFSVEALPVKPSTKLNCKEIGGKSHNIFSTNSESDAVAPSTKVNCPQVGGKSNNIFSHDAPVQLPSTKINSAFIGGKYSISFHMNDPDDVPSSSRRTDGPNVASPSKQPKKPVDHFIGSGFVDKQEPKFVPGKKLDPSTNVSHVSISGQVEDELLNRHASSIADPERPIHRSYRLQSSIQF